MRGRLEDLVMRNGEILEHLPESLDLVQLQVLIPDGGKPGLLEVLLPPPPDEEVLRSGLDRPVVLLVVRGHVSLRVVAQGVRAGEREQAESAPVG